jgi:hypothetical protein
MKELQPERIEQLLRQSLSASSARGAAQLRRDLWPAMQRRLEAPPAAVPWLDWALLAAVAVWLLFSPGAIPVLLYHL